MSATNDEQQLLRELYAGVATLTSEQKHINRRLGIIETGLQKQEDQEDAKRSEWWTWAAQTIGQVLLGGVLLWLGQQLGISLPV